MITIYKGGLTKRIQTFEMPFWLSQGWSMTPPSSTPAPSGGGNETGPGGASTGPSGSGGGDFNLEQFIRDVIAGAIEWAAPGGGANRILREFIRNDDIVARTSDGQAIRYGDLVTAHPGFWPPGGQLTFGEFNKELQGYGTWLEDNFGGGGDDGFNPTIGGGGSGGGGGRGGGASGPTYVKPDERLVRDAVEARLVALTGVNDKAQIDNLVDTYMSEHKRAFDKRETEQIDPMRTVTGKIEGMAEYKAVHQLRPDSEDPMQWIATRQGALLRAGVSVQRSNDQAIQQATIAATADDAARAGEFNTFNATGRLLPGFFQNVQNSARSALQLL